MKELRTLGLIKLIELLNTIPEFDYQVFVEEIFQAAVWPRVRESLDCFSFKKILYL